LKLRKHENLFLPVISKAVCVAAIILFACISNNTVLVLLCLVLQCNSTISWNRGRLMTLNNTCQTILIATDGSKCSQNAVLQGMEIAKLLGAKVYALYVFDKNAYIPPTLEAPIYLGSEWDFMEETLRQEGDNAIKYANEVARNKGIDFEGVFIEGNPANAILEFAEQNKVNMIVMGTFGKGGLERFLLGSVTDKVVRHSKSSVLVVKGTKSE
jgi:nucleotide-binding universal stress UspA family protein